ncbi:MAG: hypothetical protein V7720_01480 [Halioglobus sp.]
MPNDYASTLIEYGFTADTDFYDTVTAFDYEIGGVLFDEDSPFDAEGYDSIRSPEALDNLLSCQLTLKPGEELNRARSYLMSKWYRWLRQSDPVLENFEFMRLDNGFQLHVLTISEHSACTIRFNIVKRN